MKEYLKMSDVFFIPVKRFTEDGSIGRMVGSDGEDVIYIQQVTDLADVEYSDSLTPAQKRNALAEYTAHAINSHDELVEKCQLASKERDEWEGRACKEASRVNDLIGEVERLRALIQAIKNPTNDDCITFLCTAFRHCDYTIKGDFEIDDMKPAFILYANNKGA